jgi:lipoprotein-releasing system permease protein
VLGKIEKNNIIGTTPLPDKERNIIEMKLKDNGMETFDIVKIESANTYYLKDGKCLKLAYIKDKENTVSYIKKISPMVPYQVESWQEANEQLVAGSELRNIIAVAVSLTILLVAGFGIYNIMTMTINEKIKEIAILKALGFSGNDIMTIFITQATVIGLFGALVGVILGYGMSLLINQIPFTIAGMDTLPIFFQTKDFLLAVVFGILTTLIAGYLPSRKASKIDPVIIIRG